MGEGRGGPDREVGGEGRKARAGGEDREGAQRRLRRALGW